MQRKHKKMVRLEKFYQEEIFITLVTSTLLHMHAYVCVYIYIYAYIRTLRQKFKVKRTFQVFVVRLIEFFSFTMKMM